VAGMHLGVTAVSIVIILRRMSRIGQI